jgi:hypothetical protein
MSVTLEIKTEFDNRSFVPGDRIKGQVSWLTDSPPTRAELRLFYYTTGKGSEDIDIVSTPPFEHPVASEERAFDLPLPPGPCSFSGKLVSLHWALELVIDRGMAKRFEFVLSPTGTELDLYAHAEGNPPEIKKKKAFHMGRAR